MQDRSFQSGRENKKKLSKKRKEEIKKVRKKGFPRSLARIALGTDDMHEE